MMEQSWEMISDHFGGGTGDTMDLGSRPQNPYALSRLDSAQI